MKWTHEVQGHPLLHSGIHSFTRTAHSFACSALLASLARSAALNRLLALIHSVFFVFELNASISYRFYPRCIVFTLFLLHLLYCYDASEDRTPPEKEKQKLKKDRKEKKTEVEWSKKKKLRIGKQQKPRAQFSSMQPNSLSLQRFRSGFGHFGTSRTSFVDSWKLIHSIEIEKFFFHCFYA